ncbi:MAG: hypothetical protein GY808_12280 [Gammaproteobacteria bacterium]|nr:hypothetical protein [Gammaproteobacteria bacterium]
MKKISTLISFLVVLIILISTVNAQSVIPTMINYQGFLTDQNGQGLNGPKQITFTLYSDSVSTASLVWGEETHDAVNVENGLFNVLLGSIDTLTTADLAGERYLGIRVGVSEPEMAPRLRFASVAYSLKSEEANNANNANTLDTMDSKDFVAVAGDTMSGKLVLPEVEVTGSIKSNMWKAIQLYSSQPGGLPLQTTFASNGGTILIFASGSGFNGVPGQQLGMSIQVDGTIRGYAKCYSNEGSSHKVFASNLVLSGVASGTHTLSLVRWNDTGTDYNDFFTVTIIELPF